MKITAVIPIRSGSQRVRDKNLRPFAGSTLMENKIDMLLRVPELDAIVVNTNSDEAIALVDKKYARTSPVGGGGKVYTHRREEYYASSQCSGSEFFRHLGETTDTDLFVYAPCTSPFILPATVSRCIEAYLQRESPCDCVATVSAVKEFMWLDGKPINYDPLHAPNSQNLPDVVALNFGATVIARADLIHNCNIIGHHPHFITTPDVEAIDIDTPLDFFIAEQIYRKTILEARPLLE